jgi:hypothetical protein
MTFRIKEINSGCLCIPGKKRFKNVADALSYDRLVRYGALGSFGIQLLLGLIRVYFLETDLSEPYHREPVLFLFDILELMITAVSLYFFNIFCQILDKIFVEPQILNSQYLLSLLIVLTSMQS